MQVDLIRLGVIDWLINVWLVEHAKYSDYCIEYSVALLMNLCLNSAGRLACAKCAQPLLGLIIQLIRHCDAEVSTTSNCTHCILALAGLIAGRGTDKNT